MKVTFWGARGSLPVAMSSGAVRRKVVRAFVKGSGQNFAADAAAEAFIDADFTFPEHGTIGGWRKGAGRIRGFRFCLRSCCLVPGQCPTA